MNLLFRVDASTQIGTGHLMRCLALAQAWQNIGGKAIFVIATATPTLESRLKTEGIQVVHLLVHLGSADDARQTRSIAYQNNVRWVVVDGYHFKSEYQKIIKDGGLHLLFIDDYGHAFDYYADIILNQNIYAHEGFYESRQPYTQLLLGTQYVLLRREFWHWPCGWKRINPPIASKLLVTMGGADPDNVTLKVIQGLQQLERQGLEAVVVVGGNNPHYEYLQLATQESQFPIHLKKNVTNMPELMAWADLAVTAGGSTCWELAFMGLPSLILILAENQQAIAQKLNEMGVARNLGWHKDISAINIADAVSHLLASNKTRLDMTKCGLGLVDGKGAARVVMFLTGKNST